MDRSTMRKTAKLGRTGDALRRVQSVLPSGRSPRASIAAVLR